MRSSAGGTVHLLRRGELAGNPLAAATAVRTQNYLFLSGREVLNWPNFASSSGSSSRCDPVPHLCPVRQVPKPGVTSSPPRDGGSYAGQCQTKTWGQQLQRRALRQQQHFTQETSKYGRIVGEGQEAEGSNPKPHWSLRSPFEFGVWEVPLGGNGHDVSVPHAAEPSIGTKDVQGGHTMDARAPCPSKLPRPSVAPA